ncbi:MAG: S-layer protein, partial [Actinomycetota bacterium]
MQRWLFSCSALTLALAAPALPVRAATAGERAPLVATRVTVTPASFKLVGPDAEQQLLLSRALPGKVTYASLNPKIARVSPAGLATPVSDGVTRLRIRWKGGVTDAVVAVKLRNAPPPGFEKDIQPILSRAGCSSGTCHGKAEGQHGFRLSLFGFDPEFDYEAITRGASGRRVAKLQPERSLLLLKATSSIPHAGGARLTTGSRDYRALVRWIAFGAPLVAPGEPALAGIKVFPSEQSLRMDATQRLIVTAQYADGSTRDVTR